MSFFTPSDLLRLEQETANYIMMVRRSMDQSQDDEHTLEINFWCTTGRECHVSSAVWHRTGQMPARDVFPFFAEADFDNHVCVPSNIMTLSYLEMLFLKVTNGLGGTLRFHGLAGSAEGNLMVTLQKLV